MATFGNFNFDVLVTPIAFTSGTKVASPYTPQRSGTLQYISVHTVGSTHQPAKIGIYDDSSGPDNFLAVSPTELNPFDGSIYTVPITASLTASQPYWPSVLVAGNSSGFSGLLCVTGSGTTDHATNAYASGFIDPWGSTTSTDAHSFVCNLVYTPTLAAGSYLGEITGGPQSSSIGASPFNADQVWVLKIVPPVDGTIDKFFYYMGNAYDGGASALARFLVFDNHVVLGSNLPNNKIGQTPDVTVMTINENEIDLPAPVSLTGGQIYYIGVQSLVNLQTFMTLSATAFIGTASFAGGAPSTFPTPTAVPYAPTFWANFTPTSPPPPPPPPPPASSGTANLCVIT